MSQLSKRDAYLVSLGKVQMAQEISEVLREVVNTLEEFVEANDTKSMVFSVLDAFETIAKKGNQLRDDVAGILIVMQEEE